MADAEFSLIKSESGVRGKKYDYGLRNVAVSQDRQPPSTMKRRCIASIVIKVPRLIDDTLRNT